ncbi:MAG: hypothetical protein AAB276_05005 [Pseudomonadota bacterium]
MFTQDLLASHSAFYEKSVPRLDPSTDLCAHPPSVEVAPVADGVESGVAGVLLSLEFAMFVAAVMYAPFDEKYVQDLPRYAV